MLGIALTLISLTQTLAPTTWYLRLQNVPQECIPATKTPFSTPQKLVAEAQSMGIVPTIQLIHDTVTDKVVAVRVSVPHWKYYNRNVPGSSFLYYISYHLCVQGDDAWNRK